MPQILIDNLQSAYSSTLVENNSNIQAIISSDGQSNELYVAQTLIKNNVIPSLEVIASNTGGGATPTFNCSIDQSPSATVTFDDTYKDDTSLYGTGFYVQSTTCKKWQTTGTTAGLEWATSTLYTDPTWNGTSYTYPSGRISDDYPAFAYCENLGSGWRLPTKREMFSIMTDTETNSSGKYTKLASVSGYHYWTSTSGASYLVSAWYGDFDFAYMNSYNKTVTGIYTICTHD